MPSPSLRERSDGAPAARPPLPDRLEEARQLYGGPEANRPVRSPGSESVIERDGAAETAAPALVTNQQLKVIGQLLAECGVEPKETDFRRQIVELLSGETFETAFDLTEAGALRLTKALCRAKGIDESASVRADFLSYCVRVKAALGSQAEADEAIKGYTAFAEAETDEA